MKKIILLVSLILGFYLIGCTNQGENTLEALRKKDVITIGVFSDKPPFGFINKKGQNDGFDVLIAKQIAKDGGIDF